MSSIQVAGMHAPDCAGSILAQKAILLAHAAKIVSALTNSAAQVSHGIANHALPTNDEPPALTIIITTSVRICPHQILRELAEQTPISHIGILVICGRSRSFTSP